MSLRALALTLPLLAFACAESPASLPAAREPTAGGAAAGVAAPDPSPAATPALAPPAPSAAAQAAAPTAKATDPAVQAPRAASIDAPLSGKLSQADIREILAKNAALFDPCYTIAVGAGKSKQFVATVTIKATIGPTGTINQAQLLKSTAKNPKVDACVMDAFKRIPFPPPKDGGTSVITTPIDFNGTQEVVQ